MLRTVAVLVVDDGYDLMQALRRAAQQHALRLRPGQPGRETLQAAIREYRALFKPGSEALLCERRRLALEAMDAFGALSPRLVGPLVAGDGPLDLVRLLVFNDTAETVALTLADWHIPWQSAETTLLHSAGKRKAHPTFRFVAGDIRVEIVVLQECERADPPRDPLSPARLPALDRHQLALLVDQA